MHCIACMAFVTSVIDNAPTLRKRFVCYGVPGGAGH